MKAHVVSSIYRQMEGMYVERTYRTTVLRSLDDQPRALHVRWMSDHWVMLSVEVARTKVGERVIISAGDRSILR